MVEGPTTKPPDLDAIRARADKAPKWYPATHARADVLALLAEIERLRLLIVDHHAVGAYEGKLIGDRCPVCVALAQEVEAHRTKEPSPCAPDGDATPCGCTHSGITPGGIHLSSCCAETVRDCCCGHDFFPVALAEEPRA